MVLMCSKKRARARLAVLASIQSCSRQSQTVWMANASRLRVASKHGEMLLAVAEVMFEVVAVGLKDVEAFVLDLPACPGAGHDLGNGIGCDGQRGHEGAGLGDLALGVGDADPVDQHGVATVAQRRVRERGSHHAAQRNPQPSAAT